MIIKDLIEELINEKKREEDVRELAFRRAKENFIIAANRFIKYKDYINGIDSFNEFQRMRKAEMSGDK
jgi:hypothetical protein|nr:MAG TPA: hypothetical protein [Caudoviricetes sp.]